jgi:hypothetical protein
MQLVSQHAMLLLKAAAGWVQDFKNKQNRTYMTKYIHSKDFKRQLLYINCLRNTVTIIPDHSSSSQM